MKQATQSSFNEGLLMDMNPLVTPQTCLSDCLNGTLITFNGNEFTLQNDSGNVKIDKGKLPDGFIPVGMKEYGSIIYTTLLNPVTNVCQIGSIPSPDFNRFPRDHSEEGVNISFNGDDFKNNITKLFEFDQFALNPGDLYKIVYSINKEDISKIYNVEWLAIDGSGKRHSLKDPNIVSSELENYKHFNQTIKAILGLEITLNNINWFEVAGYTNKVDDKFEIKLQLYGKNIIQNTSNSEDDLFIRGCKVEYGEKDDIKTIYVWDEDIFNSSESNNPSEDVLTNTFSKNVILPDSYDEEVELNFEITPFNQFKMLDDLKRTLFLKTGQTYIIDGLNDLFQYKYDSSNKSLRLDFTANLRGMEDPLVYLEFYDVWSDYSVIVPVNDPNPFGKNSVFISTSSERCIKEFNNTTRGGIPTRELIKSEESLYIPLLNGVDNLIRNNQILRENNLYIVRIVMIENPNDDNLRKYHNVYKAFTLNENLNNIYSEYQYSENQAYKDFSILKQGSKTIGIKHYSNEIVESTLETETDSSGLSLNTNDMYYEVLTSDVPTKLEIASKNLNKTKTYDLQLDINDEKLSYGYVNDFEITSDLKISHLNKNIVETDEKIKSNSDVKIVSHNNKNIVIENKLTTNRIIKAQVQKENKNVRSILKETSVWDTLVKDMWGGPSGYITNHDEAVPNLITIGNTTLIGSSSDKVDDWGIQKYFDNPIVRGTDQSVKLNGGNISGGILYWQNKTSDYYDAWGKKHDLKKYNRIKEPVSLVPDHINNYLICLANKDGNYYPVYINDRGTAISALKSIKSYDIKSTDYRLYYYGDLQTDKESTSYTKPDFLLTGEYKVDFIQHFHSLNEDVNQKEIVDKLNEIILSFDYNAELISDESNKYLEVVNSNNYIDFTVSLADLEITSGVDNDLLNKLINSKNDLDYNESKKLTNTSLPSRVPHSANYAHIANKFSVSYTSGNFATFKYNHAKLERTQWEIQKRDDKNAYQIDTTTFEL